MLEFTEIMQQKRFLENLRAARTNIETYYRKTNPKIENQPLTTTTNPETKPKPNLTLTLNQTSTNHNPKLKQTTLKFPTNHPLMNQTTPHTTLYQTNQPKPNPQLNQPKQHTPEETTPMKNAEQQQTTTEPNPSKLKQPPDLKKTMKPAIKTTPKSRKQTNKSKQQQTNNIKSIKLFFEQFQQKQTTTTSEENTTTTTPSKKSEDKVTSSKGPATGIGKDASKPQKPKPGTLEKNPHENFENLTPLPHIFPEASRNLPCTAARGPAAGEYRTINWDPETALPRGTELLQSAGLANKGEQQSN